MSQGFTNGGNVSPSSIQNSQFTYATDTGSANAYAVALEPPITVLEDGQQVSFKAANGNTTASTMATNGLSAVPIVLNGNTALTGGEIVAGGQYSLTYNAGYSAYVLKDSSLSGGVNAAQVQQLDFNVGTDTGIADAYVVNLAPSITSYTNSLPLAFTPANANATTTPTVNVNSIGAVPIKLPNGQTVQPGDLTGTVAYMIYSTGFSAFVLLNPYVSFVSPFSIQAQSYTYAIDSGTVNAVVLSFSPTIQSNSTFMPTFQCANTNNGPTTIDCGFGALPLVVNNNVALSGGELIAGASYTAVFNNALNSYILLNPSHSVFPTVQVFDTGSGTYTTPAGATFLKVKMVGGGGGSEGSGTSLTGTAGGNGVDTTFGTATASHGGGGGAVTLGIGGTGGNASGSSTLAFDGARGADGQTEGTNVQGGFGGASGGGLGAGTPPGSGTGAGLVGTAYGSGASGSGAAPGGVITGAGGGGAGYNEWWIGNPASSYSYSVGAGGAGGSAGASGADGGAGSDGIIIVEEYYY